MALSDKDPFSLDIRLEKVEYNGFRDWFIQFHPITALWSLQPTFILSQITFLIGGVTTLIHALLSGGRWPYLWIAAIVYGIFIEITSYILPNVNSFWHSITPIMFAGNRLPLYIITLYPCFYYQATFAAIKLNLPQKIQPFAVALFVVLIDIPYDIMGVTFVHWTWHDTDPNIFDRHYWVPWNSYFFHATFSAGFTFWFNYSCADWKKSAEENLHIRQSISVELKSVAHAVLFGVPTGILIFIMIYHPLHDIFKIHSEVTFFSLFSIFSLILLTHILKAGTGINKRTRSKDYTKILIPHLIIHYGLFYGCSIFGSPEKEISIGLHEPLGPCNEYETMRTALGMELTKKKYLCTQDYDEAYFDFHCIPKGAPLNKAIWYGICGTPFSKRIEYIVVLSIIVMTAASLFYTLHAGPKKAELGNNHKKKA